MKSIYFLFLLILLGLSKKGYTQSDFILQFGKAKYALTQIKTKDNIRKPIKVFAGWALNDKIWSYFYRKDQYHQYQFGRIDTGVVYTDALNPEIGLLKDTVSEYRRIALANEMDIFESGFLKIELDHPAKIDTMVQISPITLNEELVVITDSIGHFMADLGDLSYPDFLSHVEEGFFIRKANKTYKAKSALLFYSTLQKEKYITIDYNSKINQNTFNDLKNSGCVCIRELVFDPEIATEPFPFAGYLTINKPNARLQENVAPSFGKEIITNPFTNFSSKDDLAYSKKIDSLLTALGNPKIPDPTPTLNGKMAGGNLQFGQLRSFTGIVAVLDDFKINVQFKVIGFRLRIFSDNKENILHSKGPLFTKEMENEMLKLRKGDSIVFDEIIVTGRDKTVRTLHPMEFFIIP